MKLSITIILFAIFASHVIATGRKRVKKYRRGMSKRTKGLRPASVIPVIKEPMDESTSVPNLQQTASIEHTVVAKEVTQPESSKVEVLASAPDAELSDKIRGLLEGKEYKELVGMTKGIKGEELDVFARILATLITSPEQIEGISEWLGESNEKIILPAFFVYGNIELCKEALNLRGGYNGDYSLFKNRIADPALQLVLKGDAHTRFLDLNIMFSPETTGPIQSCNYNAGSFCKNMMFDGGVHLRRFLTSRCTLDTAHQGAFDNFLTYFLGTWFIPTFKAKDQIAKEFLSDVLGLPLQVPHTLFMESINLREVTNLSIFLDTVHKEAIEEGLKMKDNGGDIILWNAIRGKFPEYRFPKKPLRKAVNFALSLFKTKEEMEMEQREGAFEYLAPLGDVLPPCLFPIILDYEPLFDARRKIKAKVNISKKAPKPSWRNVSSCIVS